MRSGIHTRLPLSSLDAFKEGLEFQAEDEGVSISIKVMPDGDGTVTVEWTVGPAAPAATVPVAPVRVEPVERAAAPPVAPTAPRPSPPVPQAAPPVPPPAPASPPSGEPRIVHALAEPAPAEKALFTSAKKIGDRLILYRGPGGSIVRQDGSRAWRNNNPGNIRKGDFTLAGGAIGDDGSFACFPSEAVGFACLSQLLRGPKYAPLTMRNAMLRYAPPSDDNDTEAYIAALVQKTRIPESRVLSTFSKDDLQRFMGAIRDVEGWRVGIERSA